MTFALLAAGLIARGEAAGADARAYWAGVRFWLTGGDPYHPSGPFLPYVYAPWMLPLFVPWAVLPWDVAWFVWRGGTILLLLWTVHWAYRRRPLTTAVIFAFLAFPFGANLDTGNINLQLTLMLWAAQFTGPRVAGLLWALATWMKWMPVVFWPILARDARRWGLAWLAVSVGLSILTLPLTIVQLQTLFGFGARPIRLDYLVYLWAFVPWLYRRPEPFDFLRRATWRRWASEARACARQSWTVRHRADLGPHGPVLQAALGTVGARPSDRIVVAAALVHRPEQPRADGEPDGCQQERRPRTEVRRAGRREPVDDDVADEAGHDAVRGGRDVRDPHEPAGRGLRDDVGHERPVHRQEAAAADPDQARADDQQPDRWRDRADRPSRSRSMAQAA